MSGRQIELIKAGVCHWIDDLFAERQDDLRWKVRRPGHELYQIAQLLVRCITQKAQVNNQRSAREDPHTCHSLY